MRGISKRFGAVQAADAVDLTLNAGDILGLLGENGAGKTTLMNVLFGTYAADAGTIEVEGRAVSIRNSADALNFGIGMVHQHFELVPRHTVLENLLVGKAGPDGRLSRATTIERLAQIGRDYHLDLDPDRLVGALSVGEQQRVEIAKSLVRGLPIDMSIAYVAMTSIDTRMLDRELKKGSAELIILSIVEPRARHGYEISKLIETLSAGQLKFHVASLYPLLYRLEERGWLQGRWVEKPGERRRRFYSLTAEGRRVLTRQRETWKAFVHAMGLITGVDHA